MKPFRTVLIAFVAISGGIGKIWVRFLKDLIATLAISVILVGSIAIADPLSDAKIAYAAGDYKTTFRLLKPLAVSGKLWLLNSRTGHFGIADPTSGKFEPTVFCPGYLRGMDFVSNFAVVGCSKPRENRTFSGLELDENLARHKVDARCGIYVIDTTTGDVVHWARIEGVVSELYDVAVLPGRKNTAAIGFRSDEIRRVISIES